MNTTTEPITLTFHGRHLRLQVLGRELAELTERRDNQWALVSPSDPAWPTLRREVEMGAFDAERDVA